MSTSTKLVIIGSGPSGYTAAIYAGRAMLSPQMVAGYQAGGQLMLTSDIENFPGFVDGMAGPQLMATMRTQTEKFGTTIIDDQVTAVDFSARPFKIWVGLPEGIEHDAYTHATPEESVAMTEKIKQTEPTLIAEAVIISTGATSIMLDVPGEQQFTGRGVSTCAVCDAAFYRDKNTYVVGGGDSAMEDTLALTKFASSVTVIHRRDAFKASKIMQDRVLNNPKVKVMWNSAIAEVVGEQKVTGIKVKSTVEGSTDPVQELACDGVFIAIGHKPATSIFANQIKLDEHGYIVTRQSLSHSGLEAAQTALNDKGLIEFPSMTSVEGVFAAGDVVDVRYKQAITAAGQGCAAAIDAERWLEQR